MIIYKQIKELPQDYIDKKIEEYLAEDAANHDYTTIFTVPDAMKSVATIETEGEIVFVGEQIIRTIFKEASVEVHVKDGDFLKPGTVIAKIDGNSAYILSRERVMLNIIQRLSGIATITKKYVDVAKPFGVKILDTRKTTPGMRLFEKYSVYVGGGSNHRFSLETDILIKDNHIAAAGGLQNALKNVNAHKKQDMKVELEVVSLEQIPQAMELGVDGFLLDNMSPEKIVECVKLIRSLENGKDIFVEASGGITFAKLEKYVTTGVNGISIGALTHHIESADIHLVFDY
ncbi:MAG: carboxylating nicotinate-nucleotide diphosphorylase [Candidatus Kapaibacterium sp.]|jgi:nicotinate-nucleotide pyrophosphorylase (carboxylating)